MKDCEKPGCTRKAAGMVVVEVKLGPGVYPQLPWQWRCKEHACPVPANVMQTMGEEFMKRVPGLKPPFEMAAGLSNFTEEQVAQLRHEAIDEGRTIPVQDVPVDEMN